MITITSTRKHILTPKSRKVSVEMKEVALTTSVHDQRPRTVLTSSLPQTGSNNPVAGGAPAPWRSTRLKAHTQPSRSTASPGIKQRRSSARRDTLTDGPGQEPERPVQDCPAQSAPAQSCPAPTACSQPRDPVQTHQGALDSHLRSFPSPPAHNGHPRGGPAHRRGGNTVNKPLTAIHTDTSRLVGAGVGDWSTYVGTGFSFAVTEIF